MAVRENGWLGNPFRWVLGGQASRRARQELRARIRRAARQDAMLCEQLEGRVVLSNGGFSGFGGGVAGASTLLQDLNNLGVETSPIPASPTATPASQNRARLVKPRRCVKAVSTRDGCPGGRDRGWRPR